MTILEILIITSDFNWLISIQLQLLFFELKAMICQNCWRKYDRTDEIEKAKTILQNYSLNMFSAMAQAFINKIRKYFQDLQNLQDKLQKKIAQRLPTYRNVERLIEKMGQYIEALEISIKMQQKELRQSSNKFTSTRQTSAEIKGSFSQNILFLNESFEIKKQQHTDFFQNSNQKPKFSFNKRNSVNQSRPSRQTQRRLFQDYLANDQKIYQSSSIIFDKQNHNVNLCEVGHKGIDYKLYRDIKRGTQRNQDSKSYSPIHNYKRKSLRARNNLNQNFVLSNQGMAKGQKQWQNRINLVKFGQIRFQSPKILTNFNHFRQ